MMGCKLDPALTEGRLIRDVGPNKMMTLISYKLTKDMIHHNTKRESGEIEHESKRISQ